MTEAGNPPKTKTGGFPASLESAIPPRFPHSHRPCGCYIGFKIQGPKAKPERRSLSSAPVPFPFRLILQLEKTLKAMPGKHILPAFGERPVFANGEALIWIVRRRGKLGPLLRCLRKAQIDVEPSRGSWL